MNSSHFDYIKYKVYKSEENAPLVVVNSFEDEFEELVKEIKKFTTNVFNLLYIYNLNWNDDLTPYRTKSIFKGEKDFEGNAKNYLKFLVSDLIPKVKIEANILSKENYLVGYSLAGLFAIYSIFETKYFSKIASISGSLWYPDFVTFIKNSRDLQGFPKIYLSLGDKEKHAKNIFLSSVEEKTLEIYNCFKSKVNEVYFEFNEGNHFQNSNERIAKGISFLVDDKF